MEKLDRGTLVNTAAIAGAVLGVVSGGYIIITNLLNGVKIAALANPVLWVAKFIGCIWILKASMKALVHKHDGVTNSNTLGFGVLAAAFSALLTAAVAYASSEFLFPELVSSQLDQVYQAYGQIMDSNTMQALDKVIENYPTISFFTQFFWCFIYGTVLSFILSGKIPSKDPFADFKQENELDEQ